jgi:S-adenosylmethionine decarboxylase
LIGSHLIFDVFDTKFDLNNLDKLKGSLEELMRKYNFSIVGELHKQFEPQGLTIVWLLEESHLSIHTWPESGKATIDL